MDLTPAEKIASEVYERWRAMPNRDAYIAQKMTEAARLAFHAARIQTMTEKYRHSREFNTWASMHDRCYRPTATYYRIYGGRGISVCERWMDFGAFLEDMGARPEGKTLDRIDPDGNYEPGNCRWATPMEQRHNRSRRLSSHDIPADQRYPEDWDEIQKPRTVGGLFDPPQDTESSPEAER